ncbi:MAG: DUF2125 domain-containing protein [Pseudomonadota bacterium]
MKKLLGLVVICIAAAGGLWFAGAAATERVIEGWLSDRRAEGWVITYDSLETTGFPTEFRTTFETLNMADPGTGLAWRLPDLTMTQGALQPDRVRVDWPAEQFVATPFGRVTLAADLFRSDLDVQPARDMALDAARTELDGLRLESAEGWQVTATRGLIDVTRQDEAEATYDATLDARDLTLPGDLVTRLDPGNLLPDAIEVLRYAAVMEFDRPWDLSALEDARPQPTRIALAEARADWGVMRFRATGTLDIADGGRATGEIAIRAENWRAMLNVAESAGVLTSGQRSTAEGAIGFIAGLSGNPDHIEGNLWFEDGFAFFGVIPIGEAPRLILR